MNFDEFNKELEDMVPKPKAALRRIAVKVGNAIANDGVENFKEQGFDGKHWEEVKRRQLGTSEYKYPKTKDLSRRMRDILISRTVALKKAVQNSYKGFMEGYRQVTINIKVDSDHAGYIQDGTEKMVARPFVGQTPRLDNKITNIIEQELVLDK